MKIGDQGARSRPDLTAIERRVQRREFACACVMVTPGRRPQRCRGESGSAAARSPGSATSRPVRRWIERERSRHHADYDAGASSSTILIPTIARSPPRAPRHRRSLITTEQPSSRSSGANVRPARVGRRACKERFAHRHHQNVPCRPMSSQEAGPVAHVAPAVCSKLWARANAR